MKEKINSISHLNFIMTCMILILHTRAGSDLQLFNSIPDWYYIFDRIVVNITTVAVPSFFAISAYLLFKSYALTDYTKKIKSRINTLVIPYIIFSVLGLIIANAKEYIKEGKILSTPESILSDIYYCTYDSPIWYLRALFYFLLFSPILLCIYKNFDKYGMTFMLFVSIITNIFIRIPYDSFFYWMPVLTIYSYIAYKGHKIEIKESWQLGGGILLIIIFMIEQILVFNIWEKSNEYWLYRMNLPLIVIPLATFIRFKTLTIYRYTFLVYLVHGIIAPIVYFAYKGYEFSLLTVFAKPTLTIAISFAVAIICSKLPPRVFNVLNGNR